MSSLLPTLLKAQTSPHTSLATKMTLRDCTLFVQVPKELISDPIVSLEPVANNNNENNVNERTNNTPNGPAKLSTNNCYPKSDARRIRIIIADLDEKSQAGRGEYWQSLEDALIKGDYYLGNGKLDNSTEDCDLSDVVWTSN
jgi:hypothetical protein